MDLLTTLRRKISDLPDGESLPGLRAVEGHVLAGFRHLERGQRDLDETAFTDAVYRSNQAYEGAIKEAYGVLSEKKPDRVTTFEIEKRKSGTDHGFRPCVNHAAKILAGGQTDEPGDA